MVKIAIKRLGKNICRYKAMLLMMLPVTVFVIINNYMPMFGVLMAFKKLDYGKGLLKSPFVGLSYFRFLFSNDAAWRITRNTVGFSFVFIFGGLVIAVLVALLLNEVRGRLAKKFYQTIIIMPNFLSIVVVSYIVYAILDPAHGLMNNSVLPALGADKVEWYSKPNNWVAILPIVNFWMTAGVSCIIYLAGITGIDPELYEAAIVDGASKRQQVRFVTLPMIRPIMVISLIMAMGGLFRSNFGLFYQVTMNSPLLYPVTDTIDTYVYRALTGGGMASASVDSFGRAAASGLYQSVVGAFLVVAANYVINMIDPELALF